MSNNLNDLNEKIAAFKAGDAAKSGSQADKDKNADNMNVGMRAGTELVASLIAGGLIGYGLDSWLGTAPWMLMLFMFLGICTGFWGVYRITNNMGSAVGFAGLQKQEKQGKNPAEIDVTEE